MFNLLSSIFVLSFYLSNAANITFEVSLLSSDIDTSFCDVLTIGGDLCSNYGIQDFVNSLTTHFATDSTDASVTTDIMASIVNSKIHRRIQMITNISNALTQACITDLASVEMPDFEDMYFGGSDNLAANLPSDMAYSDAYGMEVSMDYSVLRVPEDVDIYSDNVQYDATVSFLLDYRDIFRDSFEQLGDDNEYNTCYFGTVNGVFRIYPGRETTKNTDGSYKSYDPRYRPWFVTASSGSKDVIILIDTSGSMTENNRLQLAQEAVLSVLNTLGQNSFVNVIAFNDESELSCFGSALVRATDANIAALIDFVENDLRSSGDTNFEAAFTSAFDALEEHVATYGRNCQASILFLTDGYPTVGGDAETVITNRNDESIGAVIFAYTLGSEAESTVPRKLAAMTNGIYTHIDDNDDSLATTMSSFYLYFAFGLEMTSVSAGSPYISFSTGNIQLTLSMPVYINDSFVGVVGCDLPLEEIDNAVGDYSVGYKSYSFLMDNDGSAYIHPNLPDYSEYTSGTLDEAITTDITNLEPDEFTSSGLRTAVLNADESGYAAIDATIKQSAGDVEYDGYVQFDGHLLYLYTPIEDTTLSFVVAVYSEDTYTAPNVADFGLDGVPQSTCDESYTSIDQLTDCRWDFNMNCRLDLAINCSVDYLSMSGIEEKSESDYFRNYTISPNYTCWHLSAGLYTDTTEALSTDPTCDEFTSQHTYANRGSVSTADLPFSGFRTDSTLNSIETLSIFAEFWRPEFFEPNSTLHAAWFGVYDGTHISYPAKVFSKSYVNTERPWYQRAISYPDYLTFSTPYQHAVSQTTVVSGSKVIFGPGDSSYPFGVAGFDFVFSEFITFVEESLPTCSLTSNSGSNECFLVDSSGFLLYYDGIDSVNENALSNVFLGTSKPTLMQALINLEFYEMESFVNYETYTNAITYKANHDIYIGQRLDTTLQTFDYNNGEFTIHWIIDTNIYLIFVEDYWKTKTYPDIESECGNYDTDDLCPDVYTPGCVTDILTGECESVDTDVCTEEDTLEADDVCNDIDLPDAYKAMLEDGVSTDMCGYSSYLIDSSSESGGLSSGAMIGIIVGAIVAALFAIIICVVYCCCKSPQMDRKSGGNKGGNEGGTVEFGNAPAVNPYATGDAYHGASAPGASAPGTYR